MLKASTGFPNLLHQIQRLISHKCKDPTQNLCDLDQVWLRVQQEFVLNWFPWINKGSTTKCLFYWKITDTFSLLVQVKDILNALYRWQPVICLLPPHNRPLSLECHPLTLSICCHGNCPAPPPPPTHQPQGSLTVSRWQRTKYDLSALIFISHQIHHQLNTVKDDYLGGLYLLSMITLQLFPFF